MKIIKSSLKEYLDDIIKIEYEDGSVENGSQNLEYALTLDYWKFFVVPNGSLGEDVCADCTYLKKQIRIIEDDKDSDITLLHELIHAFDDMLKEFSGNYYSYVFMRLYDKLRGCIPDLIDKISLDNHILLVEQGHNPMFLLKSFDLDLRLNLPHGTIYAYNREEYFNNK